MEISPPARVPDDSPSVSEILAAVEVVVVVVVVVVELVVADDACSTAMAISKIVIKSQL